MKGMNDKSNTIVHLRVCRGVCENHRQTTEGTEPLCYFRYLAGVYL